MDIVDIYLREKSRIDSRYNSCYLDLFQDIEKLKLKYTKNWNKLLEEYEDREDLEILFSNIK